MNISILLFKRALHTRAKTKIGKFLKYLLTIDNFNNFLSSALDD